MAGKSKRVLPFNSQAVMKAAAVDGKQTEYRIEGERGLVLIVSPEGMGSYFFRYQIGRGAARKFRTEKVGRRDDTSLAQARAKAGELRLAVGGGADPVAEKEARSKAQTFRQLFDYRETKDGGRARKTLADYRASLEKDVFEETGQHPGRGDHRGPDCTGAGGYRGQVQARCPQGQIGHWQHIPLGTEAAHREGQPNGGTGLHVRIQAPQSCPDR